MKTPDYWWFRGATVTELTKRLNAMPDGDLIVRLDGDGKLWLSVVSQDQDARASGSDIPGELDESWPCPPICR